MYIVNGICYAGTRDEDIKVIEAKPLIGGMLLVTFASGEKRLYDTTLLTGGAFTPLKDPAVFQNPTVCHGVVTWMDGEIDIASETLYWDSIPYDSSLQAI